MFRLRKIFVFIVVLTYVICACSGAQIKCNDDGCSDTCVGDICTCATGENCEFFCETNTKTFCQGKTVIAPPDAGEPYDFEVKCTRENTCINLVAHNVTSIQCQHDNACDGAELTCAGRSDPSATCFIDCNQENACVGAHISCPPNAGCIVKCQNDATCDFASLDYSPFHPFQLQINNYGPADIEPLTSFYNSGCNNNQWLCSGNCWDHAANCSSCVDAVDVDDVDDGDLKNNQGVTFDIEVDEDTDGIYVTDFTVNLRDDANDMTFRVWFTRDGDSEANHRSEAAWNNDEWIEVAMVKLNEDLPDENNNLFRMRFTMNEFIPAGARQGVYIEHDEDGDAIRYAIIEGSTGNVIGSEDGIFNIIGGAGADEAFETDVNEDRAFVGSVCYIQAAPPYDGTPVTPTVATDAPTAMPTNAPTAAPTAQPTSEPTAQPTSEPTARPTSEPTAQPTSEPTAQPTLAPTARPTSEPTAQPTTIPTEQPTLEPTAQPTTIPTEQPTSEPTARPTSEPTAQPTSVPSPAPTPTRTMAPTEAETMATTETTTTAVMTTAEPPPTTDVPTAAPSAAPTSAPTGEPTSAPTSAPTVAPTPVPTTPPLVEIVSESRFNAFGTAVHVDFLVETNGATLFQSPTTENCKILFVELSFSALGDNARCKFDSATRLTIEVFSDSLLEPQELESGIDVLTLAASSSTGLTRSDTNSGVASETFFVSLPLEPVRPVARMSAPSQVGRCASVAVPLSGVLSSGFAGREQLYEWTFACSASGPGIPSISGDAPSVTINMESIEPGTACEFQLVVTNFLNVSSLPVTTTVLRSALDEPSLEVFPDEPSPWTRNEVRVFAADVDFPSCVDTSELGDAVLSYSWQVWNISENPAGMVELESSNLRFLTVRSFDLQAGQTYRFDATVTDASNTFAALTRSAEIFVEHAPIEAVISGSADIVEHPIEFALALDASTSRDGNFRRRDVLPVDHFRFEWTCDQASRGVVTLATFSASLFPESAWSECDLVIPSQQRGLAELNIVANSFTEESVYRFAVDVSTVDGRTSTDVVYVFGTISPIPLVSISAPAALLSFDVLRMQGSVEGDPADFTFEWSEQNYAVTSRADFAPQFLRTPADSLSFALNPGLLEAGRQYAFRLTATEKSTGLQGSSIAFVQVTSGPVVDAFGVALLDRETGEPTDSSAGGYEQTDVYRLSVSAYFPASASAEDLQYYFGYFVGGSNVETLLQVDGQEGSATERLLTDSQIFPFADVRLPAGYLTLVAHVASESGLESTAEYSLEVSSLAPANPESCALLDEITGALGSALDEGAADEWFQSAQILADLLLRADFVASCVADIDAQRDAVFASIPGIWGTQSFHSIYRIQQLAQLVETLSADTDNFSLEQVRDAVTWVDTIFDAIDDALAEGLDANGLRFAAKVANILSNALSAEGIADGGSEGADEGSLDLFCEVVRDVQLQLNRLLQSAVAEQLADEDAAVLDSGSIVARAIRAASGQAPSEIDVPGSEIEITVSGGTDASAPSSVSFSSFDDTIRQCFESTDENQELVGSVIDISILECENQVRDDVECEFTVDNVSFALRHEAGALAAGSCQDGELFEEVLQCSFWDTNNQIWATDGCQTVTIDDQSVQCVCEHLTTFAVVKNFRSQLDDQCASALVLDAAAAIFFLIAYGVAAGAVAFQMFRLWRYSEVASVSRGLLIHGLIFVSCLCQALIIASLLWLQTRWLIEVCSALQAAIHFGIFAIVAHQWATLYHGVFPKANKVRDSLLKYAFATGAVFVGLILVTALAMMAASTVGSSLFNTAATVGSIGIASLSIVCAVVFLVYGSLLYRLVRRTYKNVKSSNKAAKTRVAANRIFKFMAILSTSFIVEGLLTVVSVTDEAAFTSNFTMLQSIYLVLNLASLSVVVILFTKLVDVASQTYNESKPAGRKRNITPRGSRGPLPLSESSVSTRLASVNDPAWVSHSRLPSVVQMSGHTHHTHRASLTAGGNTETPLLSVHGARRKRLNSGFVSPSQTGTGFSGHTLTNASTNGGFVNPQSTESYSPSPHTHGMAMGDPMTMNQLMQPQRLYTDVSTASSNGMSPPATMSRRPLLEPTMERPRKPKAPHPPPGPAPPQNSAFAGGSQQPSAFGSPPQKGGEPQNFLSPEATREHTSTEAGREYTSPPPPSRMPTFPAPPAGSSCPPASRVPGLSPSSSEEFSAEFPSVVVSPASSLPPVISPASTGVYIRPREPSLLSRQSTADASDIEFGELGGALDQPHGFSAAVHNRYRPVPVTRRPMLERGPLTYVSTGYTTVSDSRERPDDPRDRPDMGYSTRYGDDGGDSFANRFNNI